MEHGIIDELSAAIDEAETEFEGKVRAYDDYSEDDLTAQRKGFADARKWLDALRSAPSVLTAAPQMLAALKLCMDREDIASDELGEVVANAIAAAEGTPTAHCEQPDPTGEVGDKSFCVTLAVYDICVEAQSLEGARSHALDDLKDQSLAASWAYDLVDVEDAELEDANNDTEFQITSSDCSNEDSGQFCFDGQIRVWVAAIDHEQAASVAINVAKARA